MEGLVRSPKLLRDSRQPRTSRRRVSNAEPLRTRTMMLWLCRIALTRLILVATKT